MAFLTIMGMYNADSTLFDSMSLPISIDRNALISNILTECAELEIAIPDIAIFKKVLEYWSYKNLQQWDKLYNAQTASYNPLWNKDATYSEKETRDLHSTGESTGKVSAFNSEDFQNASKNDASGSDTGTITRERREYGNIGITTSVQMLEEEMAFRMKYNIYDIITEDFKSRFCILVY